MSASLVGSEMCIRDSTPFPLTPQGPPPARSSPRFFGRFGICTKNGTESVSYTHLTLPTICSV
eukprot:4015263-Alexandrium_andersonii.AAC.1